MSVIDCSDAVVVGLLPRCRIHKKERGEWNGSRLICFTFQNNTSLDLYPTTTAKGGIDRGIDNSSDDCRHTRGASKSTYTVDEPRRQSRGTVRPQTAYHTRTQQHLLGPHVHPFRPTQRICSRGHKLDVRSWHVIRQSICFYVLHSMV